MGADDKVTVAERDTSVYNERTLGIIFPDLSGFFMGIGRVFRFTM